MDRRTVLKFSSTITAAVMLSGCILPYRWNQKVTITLQTPQGEKSGSSVVAVQASKFYAIGAGVTKSLKVTGEAIAIDLGHGKFLFVLLSDATATMALDAFRPELSDDWEQSWSTLSRMSGRKVDLPTMFYPKMAHFRNLADPKSIEEVWAFKLGYTLGNGYALKSITLEITDDPVTEGQIGKILPWLSKIEGAIEKSSFDRTADPTDERAKDFARSIDASSFWRRAS